MPRSSRWAAHGIKRSSFGESGRYEKAIFEPLAKIFAVFGRWGGDTDLLHHNCRCDLLFERSRNNRRSHNISRASLLSSHPSAYAYGLALFRAGQLGRLNSFFQIPICDRNGTQGSLVTNYFLDAWDGVSNDTWKKLLPEFKGDNRKTALSDHLHVLFNKWLGADIFLPREFTAAFEEFELLGSLAFLSLRRRRGNALSDECGPNRSAMGLGASWQSSLAQRGI